MSDTNITDRLIQITSMLSRVDTTTALLMQGQDQATKTQEELRSGLNEVNERLIIIETLDIRNLRQQHLQDIAMLQSGLTAVQVQINELAIHRSIRHYWYNTTLQVLAGVVGGVAILWIAHYLGLPL